MLVAGRAAAEIRAEIAPHLAVSGTEIADVEWSRAAGASRASRASRDPVGWTAARWDDLGAMTLAPGRYKLRLKVNSGPFVDAVELPVCSGAVGVLVDGAAPSPRDHAGRAGGGVVHLAEGSHDLIMDVTVSSYEHRVACSGRPRAGLAMMTRSELAVMTFDSPQAALGGGRAVVYIPPGHDWATPAALLVGTHPWNGGIWTYAAYAELLREARARDVVLLMPSGLGNSLYTADAEAEVLRAIDEIEGLIAVDPRAVSIWGASMGGAGATTIGLHHPDRFATVTSYFGDSKYDLSTYVRAILPDEAAAHRVNALDVVDNARNLPVWLIHGEADRVSPIAQSEMLYAALRARGFAVRFDRVAKMGHEGALVVRFVADVVARASAARIPKAMTRVTYRSVRADDVGAYGVRIERSSARGDAYVDVELRGDGVHVRKAEGVRRITLARGAFGITDAGMRPIVVDDGSRVSAVWGMAP